MAVIKYNYNPFPLSNSLTAFGLNTCLLELFSCLLSIFLKTYKPFKKIIVKV